MILKDVAGAADLDPVGHRHRFVDRDRVPGLERGRVRGRARRLHPDDPYVRPQRLHGDRDTGRETAAADPDEDGPHLRALLQDLQADGALARDDVAVVEGVDEHRAGAVRVLLGGQEGLVDDLPVQAHVGAVLLGRGHLRQWRPDRHEHRRVDPEEGGGQCHALRVVARARGDDAGGPLLGAQAGDAYVGAAELEGAGALEVLALEVDRGAGECGEVPAALHGGDPGDAGEHLLSPRMSSRMTWGTGWGTR